ncbi:XRE family transcriptional regulator [Vibrio parahaemolyticus]|nr:XRE family transcriptional regulator [Vibrio parahaemolyticus]MCU8322088.1 helix-turn-helix domain-containing protein [Vibrio vulnificus]
MSNKLKYDKYDNCDIYDENYDNSTSNKIALMKAIKHKIKEAHLKQKEVAEILDIKQPRVSDLISLKYERFSLDTLMGYSEQFGCKISFKFVESERGKPIKANVLKTKTSYRSIVLN